MNKFFSIVFLSLVAVTVNAQNRKFNSSVSAQYSARQFRSVTDTLFPMSFVDTANGGTGCQLTSYSVDITNPLDSGYVSGTNIYGDIEKGQRYYISDYGFDTVAIDKLVAQFSIIHQSGSLGMAVGKIYSLNAAGLPDSLIATSIPVSIASISVIINGIAEFDFTTAVTVSNGFLASIDFSSCLTDTLALVQTEANCFDTIGGAWEKWSDSSWHSFNNSWNFETDFSIFPVLSNSVLIAVTYIENNFNQLVYPNPCNSQLSVAINKGENEIRIFNAVGTEVYKEQNMFGNLKAIATGNLPAGFYSAVISDTHSNRVVKFVVQH